MDRYMELELPSPLEYSEYPEYSEGETSRPLWHQEPEPKRGVVVIIGGDEDSE